MGNCTNMFCGAGHFRKQERIMRKFVRDPNTTVNQEASGMSGGRPTGETPLPIPGSVGHNMHQSYNKRQMFAYGVEDSGAAQPYSINSTVENNATNPVQHAQQMAAALENASPKAVHHHSNIDAQDAPESKLLLRP